MRYVGGFLREGLIELWVQFATGEKRRIIPLHVLHQVLGEELCRVLIKVHVTTGNDSLSTIGTKLAALRSKPLTYLSNFGESPVYSDVDFAMAEEYLVHVWNGVRSKTIATTFNQLRLQTHFKSTVVAVNQLPPTSSVIQEHLKRSFFVVRNAVTILTPANNPLEPLNYGWIIKSNYLLPVKKLKPLPNDIIVLCGCNGKCTSNRCSCFLEGQKCVIYCHKSISITTATVKT